MVEKTKNDINTLIWFCGFYEGEGSVSNDKSNKNRIKFSISLEQGKAIWGTYESHAEKQDVSRQRMVQDTIQNSTDQGCRCQCDFV